jgi:cytochrome d ubiquinol oxidase subunit I
MFVIGGISAWYLLRNRHTEFFLRSLKIILIVVLVIAPLQVFIGHLSAEQVYHYQPTKLAAMEAQWDTIPAGATADWNLLALPDNASNSNRWAIKIPKTLGLVLEFKTKLTEPVLGLKEWAPEDRPKMVGLVFYSFRVMVGIGFFFVALMGISMVQWLRGKLSVEAIAQQKWLLWSWIFAGPMGYLAVESGWIVRCVGRQPWIVYGQIRTVDGASLLPPSEILFSLTGLTLMYTVFFFTTLFFARRIILKGPNLEIPLPRSPGLFQPQSLNHAENSRPAEAQQ